MIAGLFGFVLSVLFIPGITGAATSPRWALVACLLPLLANGRSQFTIAHLLGLSFIGYSALSLLWTAGPFEGLDSFAKLIFIAVAFDYGSRLSNLRPLVIGLCLGMWVNSVVIFTGFPGVPYSGEGTGLFVNPNSMGEIAGLVLVAAAVERLWWLIPGILPAFVMANCRGAFVAVGAAGFWFVWRKSRIGALLLLMPIPALWWLGGGFFSANMRLQMWTDILPHLTFFGHGLGSFYQLYPYYSSMDTLAIRPEHLHNDWLEYVFETGAGTVFLFAFLWACRSVTLLVLIVEACFGFPTHMAATAFLGAVVAGHDTRHRHSLRHDIAAWRISFRAWVFRASGIGRHRSVERSAEGFSALPRLS